MVYPNLKQSVCLVILVLFVMFASGLVFYHLGAVPGQPGRLLNYMGWVANLPVFALFVLYAQRRSGRSLSQVLLFRTVPWKMCLPVTLSIFGLVVVNFNIGNFTQYLIPISEATLDLIRDLMGRGTPYAFAFYVLVIQAPLTEEVFCRGVILGGLLTHRTQGGGIFWSAVLFGVLHMNPWQFPAALLLGIVFAWWVVQTGSLLPALFGHALNNFLSMTSARLELFGPLENWDVPVFLPWWLFASGIVLAVTGLWWFNQMVKRDGASHEHRAHPDQDEAPADRKPV